MLYSSKFSLKTEPTRMDGVTLSCLTLVTALFQKLLIFSLENLFFLPIFFFLPQQILPFKDSRLQYLRPRCSTAQHLDL